MKPEEIIHAMTDIDSTFLREARTEAAPVRRIRLSIVLAAALTLATLTATAFAVGNITGWFRQYFADRSGGPLTPGQEDFITGYEQTSGKTEQSNGYTITLISTIGSPTTTYITLGIEAPKDVSLSDYEAITGFRLTDSNGIEPYVYSLKKIEDADGLDNTCGILLIAEPITSNSTDFWNIQIDALYGENYDEEYEKALIRDKYAGQPDITSYTEEEWRRIHQKTLLTEGPWHFRADIRKMDIPDLELISTPVETNSIKEPETNAGIGDRLHPVKLISFVLRPLDATITYELQFGNEDLLGYLSIYNAPFAHAVMDDGTEIALRRSLSGNPGQMKLVADTPILLDQVDYVLLADGTRLYAP